MYRQDLQTSEEKWPSQQVPHASWGQCGRHMVITCLPQAYCQCWKLHILQCSNAFNKRPDVLVLSELHCFTCNTSRHNTTTPRDVFTDDTYASLVKVIIATQHRPPGGFALADGGLVAWTMTRHTTTLTQKGVPLCDRNNDQVYHCTRGRMTRCTIDLHSCASF